MKERFDTIHARGALVLGGGSIPLWPSVPESLKQNFLIAGLLEKAPIEDLLLIFEACEEAHDVRFCLAGRDFPLHVTIQQATGMPVDAFDDKCAQSLVGLSVSFVHLAAGAATILGAPAVPPEVLDVRTKLSLDMINASMSPIANDLAHVTIARVADGGLDGAATWVPPFLHMLSFVRKQLGEQPIHLRITSIFEGSAYDLLTRPFV